MEQKYCFFTPRHPKKVTQILQVSDCQTFIKSSILDCQSQDIQFEYNSSALTEDSQQGIQMLTDFLQRNPNLRVELAGHTDDVGSANYNQKLSADRAEVVRKALIDHGIDATRLTAKGYGATKPMAPNDSEEHRAMNRRTEMIIID